MADEPNQGATGDVPPGEGTEIRPAGASAPAGDAVNQGATGGTPPDEGTEIRPAGDPVPTGFGATSTSGTGAEASGGVAATRQGETPLSVESKGGAFEERPELFVAGAFLGGLVLAQILKRFGS